MRFIIKDYAKLNSLRRRHLVACTPLDNEDYMRHAAKKPNPKVGDYLAVVCYSGDHLIGWAMLDFALSVQSPLVRTYVYVKSKYRRKGYGTAIMARARQAARRRGWGIRVCPWDKRSKNFFQAAGITTSEVAPGYALYKI